MTTFGHKVAEADEILRVLFPEGDDPQGLRYHLVRIIHRAEHRGYQEALADLGVAPQDEEFKHMPYRGS